ncbi:MAG: hypothetical protein OXG37_00210 [Actinomycetia bacterium]|nr:hypothetical protein [Actinomycetes bacterium]
MASAKTTIDDIAKGIVGLIILAIIIGVVVTTCGGPSEAEQAEERREDAAERAKEREEQWKGFHCLSDWDGNHDGFEAIVRGRLNDLDSMKTRQTEITPVQGPGSYEGLHVIRMEFTARNALGGVVRSRAVGTVRPDNCKATLLRIE